MSLNLNIVTIAGRLTRDPEIKMLANNRAVASMGVAINRKWKDKDGTAKEDVTFVDVTAWGKTAEHCGQYLHKGSGVYIEGHLKMDDWQTKDGQKRQALKVEAMSVQFLDSVPRQEPVDERAHEPPKRAPVVADPFTDEVPF
jgi:single-strand DNA-binding protein